MKALTVLQPWASLIVHGEKRIETRSWRTQYRGWLLIHAGKRYNEAIRLQCSSGSIQQCLKAHGIKNPSDLKSTLGRILGVVRLTDCVPVESVDELLGERERAFGEYRPAWWAWLLSEPAAFTMTVPFRGAQGLFEVPDEVIGAATRRLTELGSAPVFEANIGTPMLRG